MPARLDAESKRRNWKIGDQTPLPDKKFQASLLINEEPREKGSVSSGVCPDRVTPASASVAKLTDWVQTCLMNELCFCEK